MKRPVFLIAFALFLLPSLLIVYRVVWVGYPLLPAASGKIWQLVVDAHLESTSSETKVEIALPLIRPEYVITEERIFSGNYAFNIFSEGPNRIGIWSISNNEGNAEITYRATILSKKPRPVRISSVPKTSYTINYEDQVLIQRLAKWNKLPLTGRLSAITDALKGNWGSFLPSDQDLTRWKEFQQKHGDFETTFHLLRESGLFPQIVSGIKLVEGIQASPLRWFEVWTGQSWVILEPSTGVVYRKPGFVLPFVIGNYPLTRTSGGELKDVRWILSRQVISQWQLLYEKTMQSTLFIDKFSLFHLPNDFQRTFRFLLLVPIASLLICVLRNIVGFPTFGIFMPVLMALAFRTTGLFYGLGIFVGVLLVGYVVRRWMENIHLLLVPRMSFLLTLVIGCFTALALIGNMLGQKEMMAVGLLPFVILTMTIERFFIVIEEAGAVRGLITAGGSAIVSVITYSIISWEPLQLTFFVFPELILVVAAFQLLIGRYTGYRLSELFRFRSLGGAF